VLDEGLTYLPDDPILMVSLSNVLVRMGRPSEAVALLTPYLAVDKYQTDAHFNLALAYLDLNQPKEAAAHLETAVRYNPTDADSRRYLAKAYRALGRMTEATRQQQKAISLDPKYRTAAGG
jgi:predicted Zn-dependent protease